MANKNLETLFLMPGNWKDLEDFSKKLSEISPQKYYYEKNAIQDIESRKSMRVEWHDPLKEWGEFFASSKKVSISQKQIESYSEMPMISVHGKTSSISEAQHLVDLIGSLFSCGGQGVKIVHSGVFYTQDEWKKFKFDRSEDLLDVFVPIYYSSRGAFSCGMQHFGLPDVFVQSNDRQQDMFMAENFVWYLYSQSPRIKEGDFFSLKNGAPKYKIQFKAKDFLFPDHHDLYNTYGTIELVLESL